MVERGARSKGENNYLNMVKQSSKLKTKLLEYVACFCD